MYTTIIHPIRVSLNLSINEYCLLDTIYHLSNNERYGGWCITSKEKLSKWLGLSRASVFRYIDTFIAKGLVKKDVTTGYIRATDVFSEMIANKEDWVVGFNGKETQFVSAKMVTEKLNDKTGLKMRPPVSNKHQGLKMRLGPSQNETTPIYIYNNYTQEAFDSFWKAYPKRKNKLAAKKAFKKVTVDVSKLIEAIERLRASDQWRKDGGKYIPFPATWLNAGGWDDELAVDILKTTEDYKLEHAKIGDAMFVTKYGIDLLKKIL